MLTRSKMSYGHLEGRDSETHVAFVHWLEVENGDDPASVLHLERQRWEDMGRPEEITVTVEPGNTLSQ